MATGLQHVPTDTKATGCGVQLTVRYAQLPTLGKFEQKCTFRQKKKIAHRLRALNCFRCISVRFHFFSIQSSNWILLTFLLLLV
jgi:hypothetical protein